MELKRIFKYRNFWIGAAMMWIVLVHSDFSLDSDFFFLFKEFGYGGVDICLFASGIGCYFSLEKDPDILGFLNRRVKRLGPTYLCFIIPWMWWTKKLSGLPIPAVFGNLLGVQTLASWDYTFNWYISGLVVFYCAMPYLKRITDSCRTWIQDLAVVLLLFAVSISFWNTGRNWIVIVSRLPVFYAGVIFAKMAGQGYLLKKRDCLLLGTISACGLILLLYVYNVWADNLWYCGLYWYPFALITPGLCVFLSLLAEQMERSRLLHKIRKGVELVGIYSFEVYLVHIFLYDELIPEICKRVNLELNNLLWVLTIPVIACGVFLLNRISGFLQRVLKKWNKAKA